MIQMSCKCCGAPLKNIRPGIYKCEYCDVEYVLEKDELVYAPWYEARQVNYTTVVARMDIPIRDFEFYRSTGNLKDFESYIKEHLAMEIAKQIIKNDAVEIEQFDDIRSLQKVHIAKVKLVDGKNHMEFVRKYSDDYGCKVL